jgi:predicted lactoylglutathione lyase
MSTKIFINLPVKDLGRSKRFFAALGLSFNEQFADENMECVVISGDIYVMLQVEPYFKTFIIKDIADATTTTEAIVALGVDSRERVDELADKALAAGAQPAHEPRDLGFLYGRNFHDPDGHLWDVIYMDMVAPQEQA